MQERADDFAVRRQHLAALSDQELAARFWDLADRLTTPLVDLATTHTTPSIERSVLLRMGFSGTEAASIVGQAIDHDLLGRGAGHIVLRTARQQGTSIREAGLALMQGLHWEETKACFAARRSFPEAGSPGEAHR